MPAPICYSVDNSSRRHHQQPLQKGIVSRGQPEPSLTRPLRLPTGAWSLQSYQAVQSHTAIPYRHSMTDEIVPDRIR